MLDTLALDVIEDPWRQAYHLCPPQGLLNDPNGLIFWRGAYHVFYQWNPHGCRHENKHWAHARSTDLIHWELLPPALAPDAPYDEDGCYSGCAVEVDGDLFLLYSGNVRSPDGGRASYQCLAHSRDGVGFDKLGPVINGVLPGYTGHFRDPKAWRQGDHWYAVLGAQRTDLTGTVLLLKSPDLRQWQSLGELIAPALPCYMYECPDLFTLDRRTVLVCCQQTMETGAGGNRRSDVAGYMLGQIDLERAQFPHSGFRPLDQGFDFYAPQTLLGPDGRRLLIGWMGLPVQPQTPTVASGWMHCLTLPRELTLEGDQLMQRPARELAMLRSATIRVPDVDLEANTAFVLPQPDGGAWELDLSIRAECPAGWVLHLFDSAQQSLSLAFDGVGTLTLRRHCPMAGQINERKTCGIGGRVTRLQVFIDRSSVEMFVNDGVAVLTTCCYPAAEPEAPRLQARQPLSLRDIHVWPLEDRLAR
ncbi:glycoside hydrolase family 32 protein [Ralstonia pseudosolanacearum]|uniref:glycoside hydrolase family 32 protein n=1 Tax=Ralstonia pseudosolanacearum TaxID=1310165 RepID=UPI00267672EC|nr:glycoside hydrolase family 32 protein [Ralstonia pseudosolanacearum]MDO3527566.1 glycoside hydrolase family 32 protein [Ralstonia pseudosolanacearum]MDO3532928.1 glycoside hydrolase family 32 protein [Ralstonia pseudosolanacearum]